MASADMPQAGARLRKLPLGRSLAGFARYLRQNPSALAGFAIYLVFFLVAISAGLIAPHDPTEILFADDGQLAASLPSSLAHPLGTTNLGRDVFSQLVLGARPSLLVGITAALAVATIGSMVGLVAGYLGGWVDRALMRLADLVLGLPFLPFVIVFAVALLLWPNAARVIRSQVLTLAQRQFIEAARVTGASEWRIMFVHIAPNIVPLAFLYGSIAVGWAILTEASLSFLGFGKADTISWGTMLQDAYASQALDRQQFAWFVPPGICLVLVVLAGFLISRG